MLKRILLAVFCLLLPVSVGSQEAQKTSSVIMIESYQLVVQGDSVKILTVYAGLGEVQGNELKLKVPVKKYEIDLNKASMKADGIVREISVYEASLMGRIFESMLTEYAGDAVGWWNQKPKKADPAPRNGGQ